jgi:argininosuccinate lyase
MESNVPLKEIPLASLQAHDPLITEDVFEILGVENAVRAYVSPGSSAPALVRQQIELWKQRLEAS